MKRGSRAQHSVGAERVLSVLQGLGTHSASHAIQLSRHFAWGYRRWDCAYCSLLADPKPQPLVPSSPACRHNTPAIFEQNEESIAQGGACGSLYHQRRDYASSSPTSLPGNGSLGSLFLWVQKICCCVPGACWWAAGLEFRAAGPLYLIYLIQEAMDEIVGLPGLPRLLVQLHLLREENPASVSRNIQ